MSLEDFTIIYDKDCPLCKNLALLAQRRGGGIELLDYEAFVASTLGNEGPSSNVLASLAPDQLMVWTHHRLFVGPEAWEKIIEVYPDLKILNWLAEKLGMTKSVARLFDVSGLLLRGFCKKCPNTKTLRKFEKTV